MKDDDKITIGAIYKFVPGAHCFRNEQMRRKYSPFTGVKVKVVGTVDRSVTHRVRRDYKIKDLYIIERADGKVFPPSITITDEYRAAPFELHDFYEVPM